MYITIKKFNVKCFKCLEAPGLPSAVVTDVRLEIDKKNLVWDDDAMTFKPVAELYLECRKCGEGEYLRGEEV